MEHKNIFSDDLTTALLYSNNNVEYTKYQISWFYRVGVCHLVVCPNDFNLTVGSGISLMKDAYFSTSKIFPNAIAITGKEIYNDGEKRKSPRNRTIIFNGNWVLHWE